MIILHQAEAITKSEKNNGCSKSHERAEGAPFIFITQKSYKN